MCDRCGPGGAGQGVLSSTVGRGRRGRGTLGWPPADRFHVGSERDCGSSPQEVWVLLGVLCGAGPLARGEVRIGSLIGRELEPKGQCSVGEAGQWPAGAGACGRGRASRGDAAPALPVFPLCESQALSSFGLLGSFGSLFERTWGSFPRVTGHQAGFLQPGLGCGC